MIFEPRTAASIGLPYLYHYQRFNLEGVRSVIVDKKLYLSRPSAFNDPWDCKPCFDIDLSDDESVEAHAAYFERCDRKLNSHLGEAELAVRAARDWPDLLRAGPDGVSSVHRRAPRRGIALPLQSMQEPHDGAGWAALALRREESGPCAAKVSGPASGLGDRCGALAARLGLWETLGGMQGPRSHSTSLLPSRAATASVVRHVEDRSRGTYMARLGGRPITLGSGQPSLSSPPQPTVGGNGGSFTS